MLHSWVDGLASDLELALYPLSVVRHLESSKHSAALNVIIDNYSSPWIVDQN